MISTRKDKLQELCFQLTIVKAVFFTGHHLFPVRVQQKIIRKNKANQIVKKSSVRPTENPYYLLRWAVQQAIKVSFAFLFNGSDIIFSIFYFLALNCYSDFKADDNILVLISEGSYTQGSHSFREFPICDVMNRTHVSQRGP